MQMNDALVKAILKYVEQNGRPGRFLDVPEFPHYTEEQVIYHLDLCHQAGFITGQGTMGGFLPQVLTYNGQMELKQLRTQ